MGRAGNLVGQQFGELVVVERGPNQGHRAVWICKCADCGRQYGYLGANLRADRARCRCRRPKAEYDVEYVDDARVEQRSSREYRLWWRILNRCHNMHDRDYKDYGGRGVYVSERWLTFSQFLADVGTTPDGNYLLALLGDCYSPEHCQWMTRSERARCRVSNRMVEVGGDTKPLIEWVEENDQDYQRVSRRLDLGIDPTTALSASKWSFLSPRLPVECEGVVYSTIADLARAYDASPDLVRNRLGRGWTVEAAVETPVWRPGDPRVRM